jgi:hypothetical protein
VSDFSSGWLYVQFKLFGLNYNISKLPFYGLTDSQDSLRYQLRHKYPDQFRSRHTPSMHLGNQIGIGNQ